MCDAIKCRGPIRRRRQYSRENWLEDARTLKLIGVEKLTGYSTPRTNFERQASGQITPTKKWHMQLIGLSLKICHSSNNQHGQQNQFFPKFIVQQIDPFAKSPWSIDCQCRTSLAPILATFRWETCVSFRLRFHTESMKTLCKT